MLQNLQERLERKKVLFLFWEFGSFRKQCWAHDTKTCSSKSQVSGMLASGGFPAAALFFLIQGSHPSYVEGSPLADLTSPWQTTDDQYSDTAVSQTSGNKAPLSRITLVPGGVGGS